MRDLKLIKVYSPTRANLEKFVTDMKRQISVEIRAEADPRSVVDGSDIVVGATNSFDPAFAGEWLMPGMHVNSVQGGELDARTLERADLIVIRAREPGTYWFPRGHEPKGSNRENRFAGVKMEDKTFELGDVMLGKAPTRSNDRQITFFGGGGTTGSNGLGIQFAAVAARIYELAKQRGLGRELPLDWFTQDVHP